MERAFSNTIPSQNEKEGSGMQDDRRPIHRTTPDEHDANSDRAAAARSTLQNVSAKGAAWLAVHQDMINSLAEGTVLAVNLETGHHVIGTSRLSAMQAFMKANNQASVAWLYTIGRPVITGSGLWALRSAT
jgi:hypothetical protein